MKKMNLLCLLFFLFLLQTAEGGNNSAANELPRGDWAYVTPGETRISPFMNTCFERFRIIAITSFSLDSAGNVKCPLSRDEYGKLDRTAQEKGILLQPVISASGKKGCSILGKNLSPAVKRISEFCSRYGIRAVHIDFEYMPPSLCRSMAEFIRRVKEATGIPLSMAVFPQVEFPAELSAFHDMETLSPLLDGIVLMTYDLHGSKTGAGPVTDPRWAERNVISVLHYIKPCKVWLGVPAYGYRWGKGETGGNPVPEWKGRELAALYGYTRDDSLNVRVDCRSGGQSWTVYFADGETRRAMQDMASSMELAGTAMWRPGLENIPR